MHKALSPSKAATGLIAVTCLYFTVKYWFVVSRHSTGAMFMVQEHSMPLRTCEVTQAWQSDGFGSQFQNIISSALFAMFENKTFCVTPIGSMEHNYNEDGSFYQDIENLMNQRMLASNQPVKEYTEKKQWVDHQLSEGNASRVHEGIRIIREQFLRNKHESPQRDVAVHIRRRNSVDQNSVDRAEQLDFRFQTTDSSLCSVMRSILELSPRSQFHVFSQGKRSDFTFYDNDPRIKLRLNEPLNVTFLEMVCAKILVTATSSLSYTAALLSNGTIWAPVPFWHVYPAFWKTFNASVHTTYEGCLPRKASVPAAEPGNPNEAPPPPPPEDEDSPSPPPGAPPLAPDALPILPGVAPAPPPPMPPSKWAERS